MYQVKRINCESSFGGIVCHAFLSVLCSQFIMLMQSTQVWRDQTQETVWDEAKWAPPFHKVAWAGRSSLSVEDAWFLIYDSDGIWYERSTAS